MRTREQLEERMQWNMDAIVQTERADAKFPNEAIQLNDLVVFTTAIKSLDYLITKI